MNVQKIYKNYIKYIHDNSGHLEFAWLTIDQMRIIEGYKKKPWSENMNPFLQSTKDKKEMLAKSILEHGMIFPFFSRYVDGEDWVILGSHRLKSLGMIRDRVTGRKFLCIRLPDSCFIGDNFSTKGDMIKTLRAYPRLINSMAYEELGKSFIPFNGFNDQEYFKRWINVREIQS